MKDGPLIDPPDRVVFLYRGDAKDVGIATDFIGVRREDPLQRVPGTDLFFYEAQVEPTARVNYQFVKDFGPPTRRSAQLTAGSWTLAGNGSFVAGDAGLAGTRASG